MCFEETIGMSNNKRISHGVSSQIRKCAVPTFTKSSAATSSALTISKSRISVFTISKSDTTADEQSFLENFERVPVIHIHSGDRDFDKQLRICHDILKNKHEDWENRVCCLKKIRSLTLAGAFRNREFRRERLNKLLPAFHVALEDLRSRVVCEACITIAFLSKILKNKLAHFVELLMPSTLRLLLRTQKVFVSVALTCIRFVLQHTRAPRLVPIIANNLNSNKSNKIRSACSEFIRLILQTWPKREIEKFTSIIQETIRKGISDADAETRTHSRSAYINFAFLFPQEAERLKDYVDFYYRKLLISSDSRTFLSDGYLSPDAINLVKGQQMRTRKGSTIMKLSSTSQSKENCRGLIPQPSRHCPSVPFSTNSISRLNGTRKLRQINFPNALSSSFSLRPACLPNSLLSLPEDNDTSRGCFISERGMCDESCDDVFLKEATIDMFYRTGGRTEPPLLNGLNNTSLSVNSDDRDYALFCKNLGNNGCAALTNSNGCGSKSINSTMNDASKVLRSLCFDKLSGSNNLSSGNQTVYEIVFELANLIEHCSSNTIVTNFRPLLAKVMTMTLPSKPILARKVSLNLLQLIVERNDAEIVHPLKRFSDLVIAQVISLCADPNEKVVEAAKNCAIVLSTHLPVKNVMRIIVPVIDIDERASVKLICIEMLMHLVGRVDNEVIFENINLIVPVLEAVSDSANTMVKKATVSCMEALLL